MASGTIEGVILDGYAITEGIDDAEGPSRSEVGAGAGAGPEDAIPVASAYAVGGEVLVWSLEDAHVLRFRRGVVGALVGVTPAALRHGASAAAVRVDGRLPLRLTAEEAQFCVERGWLRILDDAGPYPPADEAETAAFRAARAAEWAEQAAQSARLKEENAAYFTAVRAEEAARKREQRREARERAAAAGSASAGGQPAGEAERAVKRPRRESEGQEAAGEGTFTRLAVACERSRPDWRPPMRDGLGEAAGPMEKARWAVYRDLRDRGYAVTPGTKFGAHFLVYPGDPSLTHARFVAAVCCGRAGGPLGLRPREVVALARLGHAVHKAALFCAWDPARPDAPVRYLTTRWQPARPRPAAPAAPAAPDAPSDRCP